MSRLVCCMVALTLSGSASELWACTFRRADFSALHELERADAVFIGRAESRQDALYGYAYTFSVELALKGLQEESVILEAGYGGGDCGYRFEIGRMYLVYASISPSTGRLNTGITWLTKPLEDARRDLKELGISKRLLTPLLPSPFLPREIPWVILVTLYAVVAEMVRLREYRPPGIWVAAASLAYPGAVLFHRTISLFQEGLQGGLLFPWTAFYLVPALILFGAALATWWMRRWARWWGIVVIASMLFFYFAQRGLQAQIIRPNSDATRWLSVPLMLVLAFVALYILFLDKASVRAFGRAISHRDKSRH